MHRPVYVAYSSFIEGSHSLRTFSQPTLLTRCQFHQYFTSRFFVWKF